MVENGSHNYHPIKKHHRGYRICRERRGDTTL